MQSVIRYPASRLLICVAFLQCVSHQICHAHPTSHVDGWIRVSDQIAVRLTLFLDDVFATQDHLRSSADSVVSATDASIVLTNFKAQLPELFSVYDGQGRLLSATHVRSPRWKIPSGGVNLQADAGLRLTWELSYDWPANSTSFSVRHRFTQHGTDSLPDVSKATLPAELRLRVRSDKSGRRIASAISHHWPHTIVLPEAMPDSHSRQNEVPTTATFVLLPNKLIHEFSLPLLQAPITDDLEEAVPDLSTTREHNETPKDIVAIAESWAKANLSLMINGTPAVPEAYFVQLLTAENSPLPASASVPSVGTRLGIRSLHTIDCAPARVSVNWTGMSPDLRQVVVHSQAGSTAQTQIIDQHDNAGRISYDWTVPPTSVSSDDPTTSSFDEIDHSAASNSFWKQLGPTSWVWPVACVSLLAGLCISFTGSNRWRHLRRAGIAMVAGSCLFMAAIAHWSDVHPDAGSATSLVDSMLKQIYHTTLIEQDELRVQRLSNVLTHDLVETLHQQLATAEAQPDTSPLVQIDEVQLTKCRTRSFFAPESADFDCAWQVNGQVFHWGHRHQRQLQLSGMIRLDTSDDRIRISQISLENVQHTDVRNVQTTTSRQQFLTSGLSSSQVLRKTCNRQVAN